jgi:hypothetical protein
MKAAGATVDQEGLDCTLCLDLLRPPVFQVSCHIVEDALHDVAALGSGPVAFWELVAARRANGIPFRTLKRIIQIFIYFVDLIASVMYNNKKEVY